MLSHACKYSTAENRTASRAGMTMRAAQIEAPGSPLKFVQIPIPEPQAGDVLIKIMACGLCHSDLHIVDGDWTSEDTPKFPATKLPASSWTSLQE